VRFATEWEGDGHEDGGDSDLEGGKLAGGDAVGGVGDGEEMAGEGDGAGEGEEVSGADAAEEVLRGGALGCGEE